MSFSLMGWRRWEKGPRVTGPPAALFQTFHNWLVLSQGPECWLQGPSKDSLINILICSERHWVKGRKLTFSKQVRQQLSVIGICLKASLNLYFSRPKYFSVPSVLKNHLFGPALSKPSVTTHRAQILTLTTNKTRVPSPCHLFNGPKDISWLPIKIIFFLSFWALNWDHPPAIRQTNKRKINIR